MRQVEKGDHSLLEKEVILFGRDVPPATPHQAERLFLVIPVFGSQGDGEAVEGKGEDAFDILAFVEGGNTLLVVFGNLKII